MNNWIRKLADVIDGTANLTQEEASELSEYIEKMTQRIEDLERWKELAKSQQIMLEVYQNNTTEEKVGA